MCAGAIVQARIPKVVIGTMNSKAGCAGSVINVLQMKEFNHQVDICKGVLADECKEMMQNFSETSGKRKKWKTIDFLNKTDILKFHAAGELAAP